MSRSGCSASSPRSSAAAGSPRRPDQRAPVGARRRHRLRLRAALPARPRHRGRARPARRVVGHRPAVTRSGSRIGSAIGVAGYLVHIAMAGFGNVFEGMVLQPVFDLRGRSPAPGPAAVGPLRRVPAEVRARSCRATGRSPRSPSRRSSRSGSSRCSRRSCSSSPSRSGTSAATAPASRPGSCSRSRCSAPAWCPRRCSAWTPRTSRGSAACRSRSSRSRCSSSCASRAKRWTFRRSAFLSGAGVLAA